jgi:two-component system, LytTR family, response regulator
LDHQHEFLALIVEDDELSGLQLKDLLAYHFPDVQVVGIAGSISEARSLLKQISIDLLFLDIVLPDGNGFDLLSVMPEIHFEVIVTTAFSSYALEAIRHSALDFLVKPVTKADLDPALMKFKNKFGLWRSYKKDGVHSIPCCHKLPLPTLEGFVFINFDDIVRAEADRSYTVFSLINHAKIMVSKPLGDFEERLINRNFIRVHKSHIINLDQVSEYIRGEGGYIVMVDQETVPVSRRRKDYFLKAIGTQQQGL